MQIFPTVLEADKDKFLEQFQKISPYFDSFQIDIQDGLFIPNKTLQIEEIAQILTANKKFFKRFFLNFDLMVANNDTAMDTVAELSKDFRLNVVLHAKSKDQFENLTKKYPQIPIGISLSPQDSVEQLTINYSLQTIPIIQVMTINPGPQGTPFIPELLQKIDQLRAKDYRNIIQIDGSVNDKTLPTIMKRQFRPDILVIGSYLTKTQVLENHVEYLRKTVL